MKKPNIKELLEQHGWFHGKGFSEEERSVLLESLGKVIMVTHVTPNPASKAMVTSRRAIGPHTDHHKASFILWHCVDQSACGGESLLIDSRQILSQLTRDELSTLEKLKLMEHKVYPDDSESHPMLEAGEDGHYRIYYSFWLAENETPEAFTRFRSKAESIAPIAIKLSPGDILVIDNRRMLHARKAIAEDSHRHLIRFWVENK